MKAEAGPVAAFEAQSLMDQVAQALWARPFAGASVLVGAGFSRNALKIDHAAPPMPLWTDIVNRICVELCPDESQRCAAWPAWPKLGAVSDAMRIAQEYELAFGRHQLEQLLQGLIPDRAYRPGPLHARLLNLPWRDVFTTNWDTLLERTIARDHPKGYSTLECAAELPLRDPPRIIKLHGSVPSQFPLIFTEEDYRRYPDDYPAMINTVHQAMMESVLLLIGFSGSDPNYLQWIGWVRDRLGPSAPMIYVAGYLDWPAHRVRLFEHHHTRVIDLARHPQAARWPSGVRNEYAAEWILRSLAAHKPPNPAEWPSVPPEPEPEPAHLQPITPKAATTVKSESPAWPKRTHPLDQGERPPPPSTQIKDIVELWVHNDASYPGWPIWPIDERFVDRWYATLDWARFVSEHATALQPVERLRALAVLGRRMRRLLVPLEPALVDQIEDVFACVDVPLERIDAADAPDQNSAAIERDTVDLLMLRLSAARADRDETAFENASDRLEIFDHVIEARQRRNYELCLWARDSFDFIALRERLGAWSPDGADPLWGLRKAGLLAEAGEIAEAAETLLRAKTAIEAAPGWRRDIGALSRHGFALVQSLMIDGMGSDSFALRREVRQALDDAQGRKCNPLAQIDQLLSALNETEDNAKPPPFGVSIARSLPVVFAGYERRVAPAYMVEEFSNQAGLPPRIIGELSMTGPIRKHFEVAADILKDHERHWSIRLAARAAGSGRSDEIGLGRALSRSQMAMIEPEAAGRHARQFLALFDHARPRAAAPGDPERAFWTQKLGLAAEMLSRFVTRVDGDLRIEIFDRALQYFEKWDRFRPNSLNEPFNSLLKEAWDSLEPAKRAEKCVDLLSVPIIGAAGDSHPAGRWLIEPGDMLNGEAIPELATSERDAAAWRSIVKDVIAALGFEGIGRERASLRLLALMDLHVMEEEEQRAAAEALWARAFCSAEGFPNGTALTPLGFFKAPQLHPNAAEAAFRVAHLQQPPPDETLAALTARLYAIGPTLGQRLKDGDPFPLTDADQSAILATLERWLGTACGRRSPPDRRRGAGPADRGRSDRYRDD